MMYVGLPQWSHPKWVRLGITSLEEYARHFNCVEGNTTLYALPKPRLLRWREQTTDDFRFCFKFPATISHQAALRNCGDLTEEFFTACRRWRTASASTGSSFPPRLARATCLRSGSFWMPCPGNLPTALKSAS
jgi:uncharacterized protein YecE (DUF72 family)